MNYDQLFTDADNLRNDGKVNEAVTAYKGIAQQAKTNNDQSVMARALQMIGASLNSAITPKDAAKYRDSINFLTQAAHAYHEAGEIGGVGGCYRDMGIAARKFNDPKAPEYFEEAINILEGTEYYSELAITYDKYGLYYLSVGQSDKALELINKGLGLFDMGPEAGFFRATTLYDRARVLFVQGKLVEAVDSAKESLSWFEADHGGDTFEERITEITGLIGACLDADNQPDQARKYMNRYAEMLKRMDAGVAEVLKSDLNRLLQIRQ